jgi:hypothetical protein
MLELGVGADLVRGIGTIFWIILATGADIRIYYL